MLFGALEWITSSYWLPPAAMAVVAAALAVAMLTLDASGTDTIRDYLPWMYTGGADGAREILAAVASSMMTVLSVTFSVTIVALTVASQQFGPRVLHNFIRKPGPQVVLGSFISTFVYSLIVLRSVRSNNGQFIPHLSVTVDVLLATVSIGALIYFIHHVSASIQSSTIISEITTDLHATIERLFPDCMREGTREEDSASPERQPPLKGDRLITSTASGYVQAVDDERLMAVACDSDTLVRIVCRPGDFVVAGDALAAVAHGDWVDETVEDRLRKAFLVGAHRTPRQDVAFGLTQLLEIALHALSPAINEPFLAVNCVDRLVEALAHLAERRVPSSHRTDTTGAIRVIAEPLTFVAAADLVFGSLLTPISSSPIAAAHLLMGIGSIAPHLRRAGDRARLVEHAVALHRESRQRAPSELLKRALDAAHAATLERLEG